MAKFETLEEAVMAWVDSFYAIPRSVVKKLQLFNEDDIWEITPITVGDTVSVYCGDFLGETGTVIAINGDTVEVALDGINIHVECNEDDCEREEYLSLPLWKTMWAFNETADIDWLTGLGGYKAMANCGFRIFGSEDYGFIFGIDGAGYDFVAKHWVPLYKARGLQWFNEKSE